MCTKVAGCDRENSPRMDTCGPCRQSLHKLHKKRSSEVTVYFDRARMMVGRAKLIGDFNEDGEKVVGFIDYESLKEQRIMMPPKTKVRGGGRSRVKRARGTAKTIAAAARKKASTGREAHA